MRSLWMHFLSLIFVLGITTCYAQEAYRVFQENDSTTYVFGQDSTAVVSARKLYHLTQGGIQEVYDFSPFMQDSNFFVKDFDVTSSDLWYAIISHRSEFLAEATLIRSTDFGVSWNVDTSYLSLTKDLQQQSILNGDKELYALQAISSDTLLLFVGYYNAAILYSTDAGTNWSLWFANQIANYRELIPCNNSYYLWGLPGDGFQASMFSFNKSLLLSPDTNGVWSAPNQVYHPSCYDGNNPACIYSPPETSTYAFVEFFHAYVDSVCGVVSTVPNIKKSNSYFSVYPNPANDFVTITSNANSELVEVAIYDTKGNLCTTYSRPGEEPKLDVTNLVSGIYFLHIETDAETQIKKFVVQR